MMQPSSPVAFFIERLAAIPDVVAVLWRADESPFRQHVAAFYDLQTMMPAAFRRATQQAERMAQDEYYGPCEVEMGNHLSWEYRIANDVEEFIHSPLAWQTRYLK